MNHTYLYSVFAKKKKKVRSETEGFGIHIICQSFTRIKVWLPPRFLLFPGLFIFCYGMGRVGKIKTIDLTAKENIKVSHYEENKIK